MEQEKPDLFTVSIGNIPAGPISIHIKIIYITELQVVGKKQLSCVLIPPLTSRLHQNYHILHRQ